MYVYTHACTYFVRTYVCMYVCLFVCLFVCSSYQFFPLFDLLGLPVHPSLSWHSDPPRISSLCLEKNRKIRVQFKY